MSFRRRNLPVALLLVVLASHAAAHEADSVNDASSAYERGARLVKTGDRANAAYFFARADSLDANDVALKEAMNAALRANLPELGMALAERAKGRKSPELAALAVKVRERFSATTAKLHVTCDPTNCEISLGSEHVEPLHGDWVRTGSYDVVARWNDKTSHRSVDAAAGAIIELKLQQETAPGAEPTPATSAPGATPPPPPSPKRERHGLSPTWFWVGVGASVVLGAVTTWSALDTKKKHDRYQDSPDLGLRDQGMAAQTRTNVLLGVTAAAAAGTTLIGVAFTDWGPREGDGSARGRGLVIAATASLP